MTRRLTIGGVGAIVVVVIAIITVQTEVGRDSRANQDRSATQQVMAPKPEEKRTVVAIPGQKADPPGSAQTAPTCSQLKDSERVPIKPPAAQGPLKLLKDIYRKESRDPTSRDTERLIQKQFDPEHFPNELLRGVLCHRSVCKIDVLWSDKYPMVLAAVAMKAAPLLSANIAFSPAPEPDRKGYLPVEVYILRAGLDLKDF